VCVDVGTPFPPLPASHLDSNRTGESPNGGGGSANFAESREKIGVPNGNRTVLNTPDLGEFLPITLGLLA
jgi:hypothetical protein